MEAESLLVPGSMAAPGASNGCIERSTDMPRRSPSLPALALFLVVSLLATAPDVAAVPAYDGLDYPVGTMGPNLFGGSGFIDY